MKVVIYRRPPDPETLSCPLCRRTTERHSAIDVVAEDGGVICRTCIDTALPASMKKAVVAAREEHSLRRRVIGAYIDAVERALRDVPTQWL